MIGADQSGRARQDRSQFPLVILSVISEVCVCSLGRGEEGKERVPCLLAGVGRRGRRLWRSKEQLSQVGRANNWADPETLVHSRAARRKSRPIKTFFLSKPIGGAFSKLTFDPPSLVAVRVGIAGLSIRPQGVSAAP